MKKIAQDQILHCGTRRPAVTAGLSGAIAALMFSTPASAVELDITGTSIMDLMQMTVTSVTKTEQRLQDSAAAVFVITGEDLRRMRVTNIPDALRLVPGLQVTQYNSSTWSVSIRGFSDVFANKLLVLMDGRTVYTPLFAGTFWEIREPMLEDIDRIEVIRGPGGTLWGANAVNGVINIITKRAEDTQGELLAIGGGEGEKSYGAVRFGSKPSESSNLRIYGKFHERSAQHDPTDRTTNDWRSGRGGFRLDWDATGTDSLTVQGDLYEVRAQQFSTLANFSLQGSEVSNRYLGGNLLTRWQRNHTDGSGQSIQFYLDYQDNDFSQIAEEIRKIFDIEYQAHSKHGDHSIVWGTGYRISTDKVDEETSAPGVLPIPMTPFTYTTGFASGDNLLSFSPENSRNETFSAFLQDEISIGDRLKLTVGSKLEHNDFTGLELQPNVRFSYAADDSSTIWGSIARAVRTPSRYEEDIEGFNAQNLESEELLAWELGYRTIFSDRLRLDTAVFLNQYDEIIYGKAVCQAFAPDQALIGTRPSPSPSDCESKSPDTPLGLQFDNVLEGYTTGLEFNAIWKPVERLRLEPSFTLFIADMKPKSGHPEARTNAESVEDNDPRHRFSLRSGYELSNNIELDAIVRYSDSARAGEIASSTTFDLGVSWFPTKDLEISLMGRNLADSHEAEQPETSELRLTAPTEVEQSVFGKVTWKF